MLISSLFQPCMRKVLSPVLKQLLLVRQLPGEVFGKHWDWGENINEIYTTWETWSWKYTFFGKTWTHSVAVLARIVWPSKLLIMFWTKHAYDLIEDTDMLMMVVTSFFENVTGSPSWWCGAPSWKRDAKHCLNSVFKWARGRSLTSSTPPASKYQAP